MTLYIIGTIKSSLNVMQGFVLIDIDNNNQIKVVTKEQLVSALNKNKDIIKNARLQGNKIVGSHYNLSDLSSITCKENKQKLTDKGVLAVAEIPYNNDTSGKAFICTRLALNPNKTIIAVLGESKLAPANVKLINKDANNRIITCKSSQAVSNISKAESTKVQAVKNEIKTVDTKKDTQETQDSKKLNPDEFISSIRDDIIKQVFDENKQIDYLTFRTFMRLNNWTYSVDVVDRNETDYYRIYDIDPDCDIIHLPINTTAVDFSTLTSNKLIKLLVIDHVENGVTTPSGLTIDRLVIHGSSGYGVSFDNSTINSVLIDDVTAINNMLHNCKIHSIELDDNVTHINRSFANTEIYSDIKWPAQLVNITGSFREAKFKNTQLVLGGKIVNIASSFDSTNITTIKIETDKLEAIRYGFTECDNLHIVDLSGCTHLHMLEDSFNRCERLSEFKLASIVYNDDPNERDRECFVFKRCLMSSNVHDIILPEYTYSIHSICLDNNCQATIHLPSTMSTLRIYGGYDGSIRFDFSKPIESGNKMILPWRVGSKYDDYDYDYGYYVERVKARLLKLSVIDIIDGSVELSRKSLVHFPVALFDTGDFVSMDCIPFGFFSEVSRKAFTKKCNIQNIIINSNIRLIEENGFAGCKSASTILIHPSVTDISSKAFNYLGNDRITTVYISSKSEAYRAIKSKRTLNVIALDSVERFDELRDDIISNLRGVENVSGRYQILIDKSDKIYSRLFEPPYNKNIDWLYKYFYCIRNANLNYLSYSFEELDRTSYRDKAIEIEKSKKLSLALYGQLKYTGESDLSSDSISEKQVFNGLSNLFTRLLPRDDNILDLEFLHAIDRWLSLDVAMVYRPNRSSDPSKLNYNMINLKDNYSEEFSTIEKDKSQWKDIIDKYQYYDMPLEELADAIAYNTRSISLGYRSSNIFSDKLKNLRLHKSRLLYSDRDKNAIVLTHIPISILDSAEAYTGCYKCNSLVYIIEKGYIVWASTLNYNNSFVERFDTSFNRLTSDIIDPFLFLKDGDTLSRDGMTIINGIHIDNPLMNDVINEAVKNNEACNGELAASDYNSVRRYSDSSLIFRKLNDFVIIIGAKKHSGRNYKLLGYDYIAQRFIELLAVIPSSATSTSDGLEQYQTLRYAINAQVVKTYTWGQFSEIPCDYLDFFKDNKGDIYNSLLGFKFLNNKGKFNESLNNPHNYNNDVGRKLRKLAKMSYESGKCSINNITQKFMEALIEVGLVDESKRALDTIYDDNNYRLNNKVVLNSGLILSEYTSFKNKPAVISGPGGLIMDKYVVVFSKLGAKTPKVQKVYTSILSINTIINLLNYLGAVCCEGMLKPIGGIDSLSDNIIYSEEQMAPLYTNDCLKIKVGEDMSDFVGYHDKSEYTQSKMEEFIFGIAIDLASCEVYIVRKMGNGYQPLFRTFSLKSAVELISNHFSYELNHVCRPLARMIISTRNNFKDPYSDRINVDALARQLILEGFNNELVVNTSTLEEFGFSNIKLDYIALIEYLNKLPKQMKKQ